MPFPQVGSPVHEEGVTHTLYQDYSALQIEMLRGHQGSEFTLVMLPTTDPWKDFFVAQDTWSHVAKARAPQIIPGAVQISTTQPRRYLHLLGLFHREFGFGLKGVTPSLALWSLSAKDHVCLMENGLLCSSSWGLSSMPSQASC